MAVVIREMCCFFFCCVLFNMCIYDCHTIGESQRAHSFILPLITHTYAHEHADTFIHILIWEIDILYKKCMAESFSHV